MNFTYGGTLRPGLTIEAEIIQLSASQCHIRAERRKINCIYQPANYKYGDVEFKGISCEEARQVEPLADS
jgi:hypothetical protein